jgi:hypothetical protein
VQLLTAPHGRGPSSFQLTGLLAERLEFITQWSDGWVSAGKVPGMITAVARRGKLVYLHASGHSDVEEGVAPAGSKWRQ